MPPLWSRLKCFAAAILMGFLYAWPAVAGVVGYAWWEADGSLPADRAVFLTCAVFAGFLLGARAAQAATDVNFQQALQTAYDLGVSDGATHAYVCATERCRAAAEWAAAQAPTGRRRAAIKESRN